MLSPKLAPSELLSDAKPSVKAPESHAAVSSLAQLLAAPGQAAHMEHSSPMVQVALSAQAVAALSPM